MFRGSAGFIAHIHLGKSPQKMFRNGMQQTDQIDFLLPVKAVSEANLKANFKSNISVTRCWHDASENNQVSFFVRPFM